MTADLKWFNANPKFKGKIFGENYKWWNLFRRVSGSGHFWGFGILQIGRRHLFFIGNIGVSILFIGKTH